MPKLEVEDAPSSPSTRRWTARRKAQVVDAVETGRLTPECAQRIHGLSEEELASWESALDQHGLDGLKIARLQRLRRRRGLR